MVKKILESMMPVMVQELSFRIIEELNDSKAPATAHTLHFIDEDENPEYLWMIVNQINQIIIT